jgi:AcrR family transcriptional regulator
VAVRTTQSNRSSSRTRRTLVEGEIRNAAAQAFLSKGVANTSLGDIASALGTARTAIYHYYKSKDELLVALIRECAAESRHIISQHGRPDGHDDDSPTERLRDVLRRLTAFALERPERVRLLDAVAELPPEAGRVARKLNRLFFKELGALIQEGIDTGAFRKVDAGVAAHAIVGSTRSVAWWFNPAGPRSADYVARQIAESAVRGLLIQTWGEPPAPILAAVTQARDGVEALARALHGDSPPARGDDRQQRGIVWDTPSAV